MQQKLSDLTQEVGLKIIIKKTKALRLNTSISFQPRSHRRCLKFIYLGCTEARTGDIEQNIINQRINIARNTFYMLHYTWNASILSRNTTIRMFNACVKSELLYGSKTSINCFWVLAEHHYKRRTAVANQIDIFFIFNFKWVLCRLLDSPSSL